jgi:hypothetical protein
MATATGITALAGAPHLITAGKPESRARKSGHPGNPGARGPGDNQSVGSGVDDQELR